MDSMYASCAWLCISGGITTQNLASYLLDKLENLIKLDNVNCRGVTAI